MTVPDPVELLRELIRFDTTNPPGDEEACVAHVEALLQAAGIETERYEREAGRPNLVARIAGDGEGPPLLLYGHVDVVTTEGQQWTRPPFAGELADGCVWGRGALDMKGGVAMLVAAFVRAHAEGLRTPLVLAVLSDEENGGDLGARFLVDEHPDAFGGARHALGEFGGFSLDLGGRRFYPIQVAEKQLCWIRATLRGPGGHASAPIRGGAMAKLAAFLRALDRKRLPIHVTPAAEESIGRMADALPQPQALVLRRLLDPRTADLALRLLGPRGAPFEPILRNTVSPTIVRGGAKVNVIPSAVELELDGRLLPGQAPDDLLVEIAQVAGDMVELEVLRHDPGPAEPDLSRFELLADVLRELDPEGVPVPMLLAGVTDARFFSRLGIQTYGFLPLRLPTGFRLQPLVHAADERVPVEALRFGAEAIFRALERWR